MRGEKIYAVALAAFLCVMLGSVGYYYLAHHNVAESGLVNADDEGGDATVSIDWEARYPFSDPLEGEAEPPAESKGRSAAARFLELVEDLEYRVEFYMENKFMGKEQMVLLASKLERFAAWPVLASGTDSILEMENGYLTYEEEARTGEEIEELAESVAKLDRYLEERGIGLLYANAGSKVDPEDKRLSVRQQQLEYTNENGDALLAALAERGVDTLDFREEMLESGMDWYDSYYAADHHWETTTQLWAASVLAERLNSDYGFAFEPSYFEEENYQKTTYERAFLGGQGIAKADLSYLEDYDLLLPLYETSYTIEVPTRAIDLTGDYAHTLVDLELVDEILGYSREDQLSERSFYYVSNIQNNALTTIENHLPTNNEGKKILMLQDSFGWYLSGYLAADVPELSTMHLGVFDGSLRAYIEEEQPDMVVILYCERNISPIEWDTHESMFDFR